MTFYKYAPAGLVRLVNDPVYRVALWAINLSVDSGVCRYDGDRTITIWDFEDGDQNDFRKARLAGVFSVLPLFFYISLIAALRVTAAGSGSLVWLGCS